MTALVAQLVPPAQPPAKVAYKPTAGDWQLVEAYQAAIANTGRVSNDAIGNQLKITGEAVRKRLAKPGCREWLNEQLERATAAAWPAILSRATTLAIRGSIDHMNFVAKVGGKFAQPEGGGPGQGGTSFTFNVLVPRR